MKQRILVISDLHLGGRRNEQVDFQMCSRRGQALLVDFFLWAAQQHSAEHPVHLVINGDIVDFLAEDDNSQFLSFTGDSALATRKLQRVFHDPTLGACFDALASFVRSGAALTLLLGNHDLELSLPGPRRELMAKLGPGRVEFISDNEALGLGPVLIEHGNRYDGWNRVDHNKLRAVRSAASRGEPLPGFDAPPGSELVVRVMNAIKSQYSFIDLLKPENEAALPLLAILAPEKKRQLGTLGTAASIYLDREGKRLWDRYIHRNEGYISDRDSAQEDGRYAQTLAALSGQPENVFAQDGGLVARTGATPEAETPGENQAETALQEAIRRTALAREWLMQTSDQSSENISARDVVAGAYNLFRSGSTQDRERQLHALRDALVRFGQHRPDQLNTAVEDEVYRAPAAAAAKRGYKVVVFGHTHLLKTVDLGAGARYLNTGTWADLMFLPPEILGPVSPAGVKALEELAAAISVNSVDSYRRQLPGFAQIELAEDGRCDAQLKIFEGAASAPREVKKGMLWELVPQT